MAGTQSGSSARNSAAGSPPRISASGSPSRSRSGSTAGGPAGFPRGVGYDPAIDPNDPRSSRPKLSDTQLVGRRVDLPPEAFATTNIGHPFTVRPGYNSEGKPIKIQVNIFPVKEVPSNDVHQYNITVSPNPKDSRALVRKVWESRAVQAWLRTTGCKWLCDGSRLAWSSKPIPRNEHKIAVDLDAEAGKTPVGRDGVFYFRVEETTKIRMHYLRAYLDGKAAWDNHVMECLNFLDHLMRQYPSESMEIIKRNFYPRNGPEQQLDPIIVVRKGTYSAFRLGEFQQGSVHKGLSLNVDVANTAFWKRDVTIATVAQYLVAPNKRSILRDMPFGKLADVLRPVRVTDRQGRVTWIKSEAFTKLMKIRRLKFTVTHRGKTQNPRVYTVKRIHFDEKFGQKGADAFTVTFDRKMPDGTIKSTTIADYWKDRYGGRPGYPDLPLVETTRDGLFPMEVCKLIGFQRYAYKLDPEQTSQMIKIAVTRPPRRKAEIDQLVTDLKWDQDPYMREYGVSIDKQMTVTTARLLQNPEVYFGGGQKINPQVSGRWDLRGKRFIEQGRPLMSWGFIGCGENDGYAVDEATLKAFAANFQRIFKGHGGIVNKPPFVKTYPFTVSYPEMCIQGYEETKKFCGSHPQILFFVLSSRNSIVYERLKKNMDCRLCTVSQMLNADHVRKNNPQYCSNVSMKVNGKLGGVTCKALPTGKPSHSYLPRPTMFIGADVSHASPGSGNPSMAAMTVSTDKTATKYAASVQTNGYRREIVSPSTMRFLFSRLLNYWCGVNKVSPQHVYYMRDGVSEGEFAHVIEVEIKELKRIFREAGKPEPRFTVIVATKRHHIRFFPRQGDHTTGDKNANPLPGTVVEHDATHPFQWDFYMASHVAIQGTARPVHYHVIMDEANCNPNDLQKMLYHHCYQYIRSTTPVSMHPAVYYSHLASVRAKSHEDVAASNREIPSGKAGFPLGKDGSSSAPGHMMPTEAPSLIPMDYNGAWGENVKNINTSMWYI